MTPRKTINFTVDLLPMKLMGTFIEPLTLVACILHWLVAFWHDLIFQTPVSETRHFHFRLHLHPPILRRHCNHAVHVPDFPEVKHWHRRQILRHCPGVFPAVLCDHFWFCDGQDWTTQVHDHVWNNHGNVTGSSWHLFLLGPGSHLQISSWRASTLIHIHN